MTPEPVWKGSTQKNFEGAYLLRLLPTGKSCDGALVFRPGVFSVVSPGSGSCKGAVPEAGAPVAVSRCDRRHQAHLDIATGPRLCPKDQPQHARMPKGGEMIPAHTPPRSRCGWCSAHSRGSFGRTFRWE